MVSFQSRQQYVGAMATQVSALRSEDCELVIRQEPTCARVSLGKDKGKSMNPLKKRKPVDPPPIVQLKVSTRGDPRQTYLLSPYTFMVCSLVGVHDEKSPGETQGACLAGTTSSSLHRLKDTDNQDGAFYVWGDLSVKVEGHFRFRFILYEQADDGHAVCIKQIFSSPFVTYSSKNFPGNPETTFLTRSFGDQGVKVRVRKEHRTVMRKRGIPHDDYESQNFVPRKMTSSQARARENSRDSQTTVPSLECPGDSGDGTFDTRQIDRSYSSQSPPSYGCSLTYDDSSKGQPRTANGAVQIPTYVHQNQSLAFLPRPYAESPQANFLSYNTPAQAGSFSYSCEPSPVFPSVVSARDHYFAHPIDTGEPSSPYDLHVQRSPTGPYFPSHQGNYSTSLGSSLSRVESNQSAYESLGLNNRGQQSPTIIPPIPELTPPMYARMNTGVGYMNMSLSPDRREAFNAYPIQTPFPSDSNNFFPRHSNIAASIEGAGSLEGAY